MSGRHARSNSGTVAAIAVAALALAALGGTALAGHQTSGVKSYTGCLVPGDGVIIKIKEGNAPKSPCTGGQVQAHFSGGDITAITAGAGLTGGGTNGLVTLAIDPAYTLPQGCMVGQVAKWDGTGWECADDNDTQYSAGTGLDLTGTTFSVEPDAFAMNDQSCSAGQFANGVDADGDLTCAALPASAGIAVWQKAGPNMMLALPEGEGVDVLTLPLPAGTYLMTAVGVASDKTGSDGNEEVWVHCFLRNGANVEILDGTIFDSGEEAEVPFGPGGTVIVHGVITLAAADTVKFTCISSDDDSEGDEFTEPIITAVKVGTLTTP